MATAAKAGKGTKIGLGNGAGTEVFNAIAEILTVSGPELSAETIEVTNLDSLAKEYIGGMPDGGSIQLEMNWISGNTYQAELRDRVESAEVGNFLIVWPNTPATKVLFAATVESWSINTEANSAITASVTMKISGLPDWTTTAVVV